MSRQFSLAHLTVLGLAPPEMTYVAARCGYDFVSLRLIPMRTPGEPAYLPEDKAMIAATKAALRETGVRMLDLELACIVRDRAAASYEPAFAAAAELGARHVISSAWTKERDDRAFIVERYAEICDLAAPYGLTVDLEFPTFSRLRSLDEAVDVLRAAARPNCGVLVDSLYFHFSRLKPADLAALPRDWLHFLHLTDTRREVPANAEGMKAIAREERLYLGEGCIDFAALLAAVPDVPLSIELPNKKRARELGWEGHARLCLETARNHIANHLPIESQRSTGTHG
ncbi:MAG: sugar phosphate isomerase/epimerase [Methylobacteriaceae bacterium]|nr:sugar phosphate isomerase/epimerase [Methylobacteriaceae bacterium]